MAKLALKQRGPAGGSDPATFLDHYTFFRRAENVLQVIAKKVCNGSNFEPASRGIRKSKYVVRMGVWLGPKIDSN
jgi:hypothetical protein